MGKFLLKIAMVIFACMTNAFASDASQNPNLQAQLQSLQQALASGKATNQTVQTAQALQTAAIRQNTQTSQAAFPSANTVPASTSTASTPGTTTTTTTTATTGQGQSATTAVKTTEPAGALGSSSNLSEEAFSNMATKTLPMTPAQIELLHKLYDSTQRAAGSYPGIPPKPTSVSIAVNLSPGCTPPIVRLEAGFVSSLVFVDSTGAPWPIQQISIGNPQAFNVQWDKESNILLVQAITAYRSGNLAVILKNLNTPVMLQLMPGQSAMDARADIRVPGLGPNANVIESGLPGTGSPVLLNLLDGIPPPGSRQLKSSICENCAWVLNGELFLRTQFEVISPAWLTTMSSADGTHVYEMPLIPVVLVSYNGKTVKMNIEGF